MERQFKKSKFSYTEFGLFSIFMVLIFSFNFIYTEYIKAQSSTNFKLKRGIFNIAGGRASSSNYRIHGTLGQAGGVSSGMNFRLITGIITGITFEEFNGLSVLPESFDLSQNYPNPFNPMTAINYAIPRTTKVTFAIYDLLGREVMRWEGDKIEAGYYSIRWDGRNKWGAQVSSGIYIYRIIAGDFIGTKKMVLLR